jgi:SagB-type dehydrogenase family enzyme
MLKKILLSAMLLTFTVSLSAQDLKPIKLPAPQLYGGKSLMLSLKERKSTRAFSPVKLPLNVLSDLLWAACGINRPETSRRTAPSASNWQEIDVYVATSDGLFLYDVKEHALNPVLQQDIRALTGKQSFAGEAPVDLVYVADFARMGGANAEERNFYSAADTGFISQNVYLYCASAGLVTVVRGSVERDELASAMKLRKNQKIILAQTIGYPAGFIAKKGPGVFNLNKVSYEELKTFPLLPEPIARRIVDYRFTYGHFNSINDLIKVRGVTWKLIDKIKPYVVLEGDSTFDLTSFRNTGS